jgi:hypothetical protein
MNYLYNEVLRDFKRFLFNPVVGIGIERKLQGRLVISGCRKILEDKKSSGRETKSARELKI